MANPHARSDRAIVARATRIAADTYKVFRPQILQPTRGGLAISTARQVAQYLAHCSGQVPLNRLAKLFHRDITTIMHNVALIEDWRDAPEFDELMATLEARFNAEALV